MGWFVKYSLVLIVLFTLCSMEAYAFQEALDVDSVWWEETTKDLTFEQEEEKEQEMDAPNLSFLNAIGPYLAYGLLAVLVGIFLFILIKILTKDMNLSRSSGIKRKYDFFDAENLEDDFLQMDLEKGLLDAIENKEWKMAMRIRYLITLKALVLSEKLSWRKDYSNAELKRQLEGDIRTSFSEIVLEIERAYFSEMIVEEALYLDFAARCDHFEKSIIKDEG